MWQTRRCTRSASEATAPSRGGAQDAGFCTLQEGVIGTWEGIALMHGSVELPIGVELCNDSLALPYGQYRLVVMRGAEYEPYTQELELFEFQGPVHVDVPLVRSFSVEDTLSADLHVHALVLDGVYGPGLVFHPLPAPPRVELRRTLAELRAAIAGLLARARPPRPQPPLPASSIRGAFHRCIRRRARRADAHAGVRAGADCSGGLHPAFRSHR